MTTLQMPWRKLQTALQGLAPLASRAQQGWKGCSQRERLVLVLGAGLLAVALIDLTLWSPGQKARAAMNTELRTLESTNAQLRGLLTERGQQGQRQRTEEETLRERIQLAEQELGAMRRTVTPAPQMLERLRQLSQVQGRLRLQALALEPAEALQAGADTLYRLPVLVTVEGDWAAITDYLQRLENGPGGLRWRNLELRTQHWPSLQLQLRVYTIAEQAAWPV